MLEGHAQEYFKHSATKSLSAHGAKKNGFTLLTAAEVSQEVALTQAGRQNAEPTAAGQAPGQFSSGSRLSLMAGNTESSSVGKAAAPAVAHKRSFRRRSAEASRGTPMAGALSPSAPPQWVTPKKIPAVGAHRNSGIVLSANSDGVQDMTPQTGLVLAGELPVPKAPGLQGRINIVHVMKGMQPGRELKSLEHQIKQNTFPSEAAKENCEMEIAATHSARILQVQNAKKGAWDDS